MPFVGIVSSHKWISYLMKLSRKELVRFDAEREYKLLDDPEWVQLIEELKVLSTFKLSNHSDEEFKAFGNVKKNMNCKNFIHS